MRVILCAATLLLLVGCETTNTKLVDVGTITQHPPMPEPIFCPKLERGSIESTEANPTLTPDAVFNMGSCQQEVLRYIKDAEATLCFYRGTLNETRCSIYTDVNQALHSTTREE